MHVVIYRTYIRGWPAVEAGERRMRGRGKVSVSRKKRRRRSEHFYVQKYLTLVLKY